MRYIEHPPPPSLKPWVHCVWIFEDVAGGVPDRIVPDGRPELVVHYRAPYFERDGDARWRRQPTALLAGQLTRPLQVRSNGAAGVVGIRFLPDGARAFCGHPMREVTDRRMPLDEWCAGSSEVLSKEVARCADDAARIALVQRFVERRIAEVAFAGDPLVRRCVALVEQRRGDTSIEEMAAREGLGRRQVERRFADSVGVAPALLAAIFRFRSVFDVIEHDATRPWTEASLAAGYYDQSHFIREFRRLVGCTPTEFERTRDGLAAALLDGA